MSSDDLDKTVFRQPSVGSDRTVIRPTPGGRGAGSRPPTQTPGQAPAQPPPVQQAHAGPAYFQTIRGLNPLVNAASTLIAVFEKTRGSVTHPDVGGLHQRLVSEIRQFETQANAQGTKPEIVLAARYVLCTALDEAVLNTPWGSESAWGQRTLLTVFHNEASGGEKFFAILERMRAAPSENLHILELLYIFLSLGFEGKYKLNNRGRDAIEQIRDDLFSIIRSHRGEYERALSSNWQGLGKIRNTLAQYIPMWVVVSIVGAVLFLSYSGFRIWLYRSSSPVVEQLVNLAEPENTAKQETVE